VSIAQRVPQCARHSSSMCVMLCIT
jgi:hypothetical protein